MDVLNAPDIPGLVFRPFRGVSDYAPMALLREQAGRVDKVDPRSARETIPTRDDIAQQFSEVPAGTPDMLLVEVDGALVGYNRLLWWAEQDGTWVYLHLGWLLPAWRHRGIGTTMLRWAERRLRAIAPAHPTGGNAVLATNASSTERDATALVLANGYRQVHALSDMALRPLDQLPITTLPVDAELRHLEPDQYRAIYRAWKDAWSGIFLTTAESEQDYRDFLDDNVHVPGHDPALWHVAWHGDEVVGLVICRIRRDVGIVPEVVVRPEWRRRGIARALLTHGLRAVRDRSIAEARIITDADDGQGARSLYESVGFREVKQHILYRKPMIERHG
jgi:ribosomal protein S18 acetylase RimI-like enzyme